MRFPVNHALPLAALILLGAATGSPAAERKQPPPGLPVTGPAADYPVVVGEPFTIGDKVWTPVDQLNYDAVGQAVTGVGSGVTGAHKTLPLPCYVEVTALDSGRTILVRLERRGPMTNDALVELSPDASAQLGLPAGGRGPVRVRRVNPPEQERALLRNGRRAAERMETPEGLLKVLRRKLADQSPLVPPTLTPPAMPAGTAVAAPKPQPGPAKPAAAKPPVAAAPASVKAPPPPAPKPVPKPAAQPAPKPAAPRAATPPSKGSLVVQVAAFSSEASARKVAGQLGGSVSQAGKFWRVRVGPYSNRAQAAPALEKVKRAGYSDARIQSAE
ncbi:SPOR domain-containing protein [Novosphingobium sp. AP12]|uniref:SPOR domain-containing protein n=1 Tax=Novosphingobium sp. AP12 TaxID=1144305 RepID=UPI000271E78D|nr:SPOR domain-containing protein [Novosphingobium sp. AP12]EJL26951.1 lipoprotein [Novosphingobium sp. AP12]